MLAGGEEMAALLFKGAPSKLEQDALRYRQKNHLLALGFNWGDWLDVMLAPPTGICYKDKTQAGEKDINIEGYNEKTKKGEPRYQMDLIADQWTHNPDVLDEATGEPEVGFPMARHLLQGGTRTARHLLAPILEAPGAHEHALSASARVCA